MMQPPPSICSPRSMALSRASPRTPPLTRSPSTRPHGRGVRRSSSHRPGRRPSLATARGRPRGKGRSRGSRRSAGAAGSRCQGTIVRADGEHVLPRHVHHRRGPSRPESSQAGECGRPRLCDPESDDRPRPTRVISPRQMRILSVGLVRARDDSCTNACAGKARSRGTRCRDVIFETLFDTLWVPNPIRPRSAASRNRVMRGPGVTPGAKRSQGARRPRD